VGIRGDEDIGIILLEAGNEDGDEEYLKWRDKE
jgi:hypothetical protein